GFLDEWLATLPRLHSGDEEEALHDYRVALRKLRSWLRTFGEGGGKAQKQLSALNEATGAARDLEVMQEWLKGDTSAAAAHVPELAQGLDGLLTRARTEGHELFQRYTQHRHASDVRLAALLDVVCERLGKRLGLHVEVVPHG